MVENIELYLASQSPRRRALLKELGFPVKIVTPPNIDEVYPPDIKGPEIPLYLAKSKADVYTGDLPENAMLVTADTIVWINNQVIEKPKDENDAKTMLQILSGNMHQVFTGICLKYKGNSYSFYDETKVFFKNLSLQEIIYYVEKYKPFDKAGAYGVQEWIGFIGVERIEGSYFNVMGLPTHRLYAEITSILNKS